MNDHAELAKLGEHELKAAIKSVWKKHEELAKTDLAPMFYYLREQLRAQGARNDIADKDRGFGAWVEENLDISRRTADRWCQWFAEETGLKPKTSGHVSNSEDDDFYSSMLDDHTGEEQIAFNCWVKKAVHARFTKALATLQKQLGLKNKKEAMVQGVLYAATAIGSRSQKGARKKTVDARSKGQIRHHKAVPRSHGHRRASGSKAMRAVAGR